MMLPTLPLLRPDWLLVSGTIVDFARPPVEPSAVSESEEALRHDQEALAIDRQLGRVDRRYVDTLYLGGWSAVERLAARRRPKRDRGSGQGLLRYQRQIERRRHRQGKLDGYRQLIRPDHLGEGLHPSRLMTAMREGSRRRERGEQ